MPTYTFGWLRRLIAKPLIAFLKPDIDTYITHRIVMFYDALLARDQINPPARNLAQVIYS